MIEKFEKKFLGTWWVKLPSQCKNMLTRTFSQANLGKMAIMAAL
jgi:hypothetical protein